MKKNEWFAQGWGNKYYIMRYRMKPEKITFNPYKNEYEKILQIHRGNTKVSVLVFFLGLFLGMLVTVIIISQEHALF
tara:strand:+ start:99 stop:329 length:231 start_codon:yes stop_codon:yes gene_type:complete